VTQRSDQNRLQSPSGHPMGTSRAARPPPSVKDFCLPSFGNSLRSLSSSVTSASDQAARAGCATHLAFVGVSSDHHDTSCGLPAPPGDAHNAKVHSRHLVTYYIAFPDQRKFVCPLAAYNTLGESKSPRPEGQWLCTTRWAILKDTGPNEMPASCQVVNLQREGVSAVISYCSCSGCFFMKWISPVSGSLANSPQACRSGRLSTAFCTSRNDRI
jgi:hypothetical protein